MTRWILPYFLLIAGMVSSCSGYRMVVQGVDFDRFAASSPAGNRDANEKLAAHHNDLGVLLEKEGDLEGALRQYRLAISSDPDLAVAYFNAGNISVRRQRLKEAIGYYRSAIRRDPDHSRALNNLSWVYLLQKKNIPRAIELLNRAMKADPEHTYLYLDSLGWAHYLNGETDRAAEILTEAVEKTPPDHLYLRGEAFFHLGSVYRARGDRRRAEEYFNRSLECAPSPERKKEIRNMIKEPKDAPPPTLQ